MNAGVTSANATRQLAALSAAMVLGMTPWFSATVAAPGMVAEWGATPATEAWLTIAVQLGFVLGTLLSGVLLVSDRYSPRRLAAAAATMAAVATAAMVTPGVGPVGAIGLRGVAGIALAGVYPPGIKLAAGWWRSQRGTAIGVLVGALTVGSAAPNVFRLVAGGASWRSIVLVAALASLAAAVIFAVLVREGPFQSASAPFDPSALSAVIRDRGVMLATGGYLGHMWELYAMWSTIPALWSHVARERGLALSVAGLLSFATVAAGAVGCVVAGVVADRVGRPVVTIVSMIVSGTCALLIGSLLNQPLAIVAAVALVWGIAIVADSAQFSAAVTELAPSRYVGTALTLQTCVGFLLTIVTIRMVPVWVEWWGWEHAYMPLAIGPAFGIFSMWRLARLGAVPDDRMQPRGSEGQRRASGDVRAE